MCLLGISPLGEIPAGAIITTTILSLSLSLPLCIKQQLQKKFSQDWFKAQNDISDSSRQKCTNKEITKDCRLEEYLKVVRNPAHRISMTKLGLGVHTLRIQTGKCENKGASIPV